MPPGEGPWCARCGDAMRLGSDRRYVYCVRGDCPGAEDGQPAGDAALEADQTPAGWPRP